MEHWFGGNEPLQLFLSWKLLISPSILNDSLAGPSEANIIHEVLCVYACACVCGCMVHKIQKVDFVEKNSQA